MSPREPGLDAIDHKVIQLFALVSEALSKATYALLNGDSLLGQAVIDGDQAVDALTAEVELLIWDELQEQAVQGNELRYLVGLLLIIPELERSGDLAPQPRDRPAHDRGRQ
jgi:phosphate transport system protein